MPQEVALYPLLTARENLEVFGTLHGLSGADLTKQVDWALEQTGLADRAEEPVKQFSGGMRRRLNIACGVLHRPRIVLLDEPTVGVDPQSRDRIYDMLAGLAQSGVSLLLTTHHLEEAEARCSRTVIIDHGKVIAGGTLSELVDQTVGRYRLVTLRLDAPLAAEAAADLRGRRRGHLRRRDGRPRGQGAHARRRAGAAAAARPDPPRGPIGRRRRGARPEPAGRLHSSDRKGAARIMGTLLRIGWLNLRRDRVALALVFALPILFFSIFATVFGGQGDTTTSRIRVAVVDEDRSELSARLVEGLRKETGLRVRTTDDETGAGPALDRAAGERLVRNGDVPVAVVIPKGMGEAFAKNGFAGQLRAGDSAALRRLGPDRAADGARAAAEGDDDGGARPDDAGRDSPVRAVRGRDDAAAENGDRQLAATAEGAG